jgi:hypothetical protein
MGTKKDKKLKFSIITVTKNSEKYLEQNSAVQYNNVITTHVKLRKLHINNNKNISSTIDNIHISNYLYSHLL